MACNALVVNRKRSNSTRWGRGAGHRSRMLGRTIGPILAAKYDIVLLREVGAGARWCAAPE
jgi:hypothetical protein